MSLIANNKLFEAVELLVLIDNGLDACRYTLFKHLSSLAQA